MKFDKKTIISTVITFCLLLLILFLVKICVNEWQRESQEGLQYYGDEMTATDAPLPYKTIMQNIKYPVTNTETGEAPIYDIGNKTHNSNLFNKEDKSIHFSDEQIMKDMKYFNNASNLLLEHYLNNNIPDSVILNVQDKNGITPSNTIIDQNDISDSAYYHNIGFTTSTETKTQPSYLYDDANGKTISKAETYLYRLSEDYDHSGSQPPTNGMYLLKESTTVNGVIEKDNIYNYDYDLSGLLHTDVYDELTNYDDSSFNSVVSMIKPGKYSSHYFESNYSDISDNVTKDFKYFYSTAPTMAGYGLFNKR